MAGGIGSGKPDQFSRKCAWAVAPAISIGSCAVRVSQLVCEVKLSTPLGWFNVALVKYTLY